MLEVSYDWYDDNKRILLISITPYEWSWNDATVIVREKARHMHGLTHEVHSIYLFSFPPRIPKDNMFSNIKELMTIRAENEGLTFFIGINRLFRSFITTAAQIGHMRWIIEKYYYVTTLEQALEEIKAYEARHYDRTG